MFKILEIHNFGLYYKPNDIFFISELPTEQQRLAQLDLLFPIGASKIVQRYGPNYLLEPVRLEMRVKLEPMEGYRATVGLDIENVDLCMQKNQLVNILRLVELDQ